MKSIVLATVSLSVLVTGCASFGTTNRYDENIDSQKITAIDHVARTRGVEIHWVNYPQRKSAANNIVPALGESTGT